MTMEGMKELACDADLPMDESALSFYIDDTLRLQKRISEHGEIPEVFRKYQLVLALSGRNWTVHEGWRPSPIHAIVELRRAGGEYERLGETEMIHGENDPQFIKRFEIDALSMPDSQHVALHTIIRVRALSQGEEMGYAETSVANLVWDLRYEGALIKSSTTDAANPPSASIKVVAIRGPLKGEKYSNHILEMRVGINVPSEITGHGIRICASAAGERGGEWCRTTVSDARMRPCGGRMARLRIERDALTGCNGENRSVRLEAIAMRRGVAHVLGFCQFQLAQLETHKWLEWRVAGGNGDAEVVAVRTWATTPTVTRVGLDIGPKQAAFRKDPTGRKIPQYTLSNSWSWRNWPVRSFVSLPKAKEMDDVRSQSHQTHLKRLSLPSYSVRFPEEQPLSSPNCATKTYDKN